MAVYLSGTASGTPHMQHVAKFLFAPPEVATLNLIYNNQILDIKLDTIANTGREEQGYSIMGNWLGMATTLKVS